MAKKRGVEFYQEKVMKAMQKSVKDAMQVVGGDIRTIARNSMKPAKKDATIYGNAVSKPGKPPVYHSENKKARLKESIWFAFDPITESVTVGPTKDIQGRSKGAKALEDGGIVEKKVLIPSTDAPDLATENRKNQEAILRENETVAKANRLRSRMQKKLLKETGSDQPIQRDGRQRPKGYRYFYSKDKRDAALNSSTGKFKKWADKKNAERKRNKRKFKYKTERIQVKPRPYMAPAFAAAMERLPAAFLEAKRKHFK